MDVREQESLLRVVRIGIVGGGLVGALAALGFARHLNEIGNHVIHVDVFEQYNSPAQSGSYFEQYDARNLVLSSATAAFLKNLGVWEHLSDILVPIEVLEITRANGVGYSCISAQDESVAALGYVADMNILAFSLSKLAQAESTVTFYYNTKLSSIKPIKAGYELQWDHSKATYDLVVAADGVSSWICQALGFGQESKTYSQQALVTNVTMDRDMPNIAHERFIQGGALTLLPLTQGKFKQRMALVWIDSPARLEALQNLSSAAFIQELAKTLPLEAVYVEKGTTKIYPLQFQVRHERVRPHLILIGNSAQTLHPIAAQGFNLAVRDIRDFIQHLQQHFADEGKFTFAGECMQAFKEMRARDVFKVKSFVNVLDSVFFQPKYSRIQGKVQDIALLGFELMPNAKALLSQFAMGGQQRQNG